MKDESLPEKNDPIEIAELNEQNDEEGNQPNVLDKEEEKEETMDESIMRK